ncbi:hypothetical protein FOXB_15493 [Fusarium oxysporum f. sp. conglutinans Fo5176]|uniref:Heterokaryon incompatibility domain-containing protein n=2 Tax=Fusarium oxysporum f. sp. conglutinans TaxID=100902 RepID=F9GA11_FUSOF|nr:hypothetical protein FOXB_15493 [Fusarium oxysporum f. sp. conglutinans Fo5176]
MSMLNAPDDGFGTRCMEISDVEPILLTLFNILIPGDKLTLLRHIFPRHFLSTSSCFMQLKVAVETTGMTITPPSCDKHMLFKFISSRMKDSIMVMRQSKDETNQTQDLGESWSPYKPLSQHRDCTRLLRIEAAKDGDPITCSLFEVIFGDRPKFGALSYMWGDGQAGQTITLNGVGFNVRQNLWDALHYLRKHAPDTDYWIDATCINQKDIPERNRQVRMMHHIYFRAQTVVVWLGKRYAEYEAALPDLQRLGHDKPSNEQFNPELPTDSPRTDSAERSFAEKLYNDDYWKRLWIIQEIGLAQKIKVCFGNSATEWKQFTQFITMHNFGSKGPIRLERQREEKYTGSNTLLQLLQDHKEADCQDRKDKVYGLVGMASDARGFSIDYNKSVFEIWTDVMEFMNRHSLFFDRDIISIGHPVKFLLTGAECDPLQQILGLYAPREVKQSSMKYDSSLCTLFSIFEEKI